ncbi:LysE family translocator [Roseibium alexandrii]|uniref:Putative threonine efflux protein n=1 Tax=Roseibium alexandrii (strain DSM 17067 / NCIMB 14079 / DFL-11) TaxID=244592 RepID=A0A5E8H4H5_ROSAD|nr:LysE family transporter [Roseibium alexandrii]EEE47476.1 putative threonine efflux protein [Roseibium alexandrii DFL-11]
MITLALAVFFLIITPGPGVLSVAGVGSAFGFGPGARYIGGLFVGTNLVAIAVVSGMATVILANENIRAGLLIASVLYLLYLAYRIAFAGTRIAFKEAPSAPGFLAGVTLQLVNPKAYAVNTTLLTGFAFLPSSLVAETLLKFLIMNLIWIPIHFGWLYVGMTIHRLNLAPHVQRRVNIAMAISMLIVVGLALLAPK